MSFRKWVPTFQAHVTSFYVEAWFFFDLIVRVKRFKSWPIGRGLRHVGQFLVVKVPFSSIKAWLSASDGLSVAE